MTYKKDSVLKISRYSKVYLNTLSDIKIEIKNELLAKHIYQNNSIEYL